MAWLEPQDPYLWGGEVVIEVTALTRMVWRLDEIISRTILVQCPEYSLCLRNVISLPFPTAWMYMIRNTSTFQFGRPPDIPFLQAFLPTKTVQSIHSSPFPLPFLLHFLWLSSEETLLQGAQKPVLCRGSCCYFLDFSLGWTPQIMVTFS